MYEADVVSKSMFAVVLEYLDGIQGVAREVCSFLPVCEKCMDCV